MKYTDLQVEKDQDLLLVFLNRPEKNNALNMNIRDELENVFYVAKNDNSVKGVLLSGNGKNFSAGYDLDEVVDTRLQSFKHRILEYHYEIYSHPKPIVSLLHGFVSGGGFDLALAGDYIIAHRKTMFLRPEIKFGAPPLITSLARKIGSAKALNLSLLGSPINSVKALELGIIDEVLENDLLEKGKKIVEIILPMIK